MGLFVDQTTDVDYYETNQSDYNLNTSSSTYSVDNRAFTNNYTFKETFLTTNAESGFSASDIERLSKLVGLEPEITEPTQTTKAVALKSAPNYGIFIAIGAIALGVGIWALG